MRQCKSDHVALRLAQRIRNGDYHLYGLPSERELALNVGVSHMTARKAVQKLLGQGLVYRLPNGRLAVSGVEHNADRSREAQIAFLVPAFESASVRVWHIALAQVRARFNASIRVVYYTHWDDPSLVNALARFDGCFLIPVPFAIPAGFAARLRESGRPVVVLSLDWSPHGIPSLRLFPAFCVQRLLDHLAKLGHRRIDCLNLQPMDSQIEELLAQWRLWMAARGWKSSLIGEAVKPYTHVLPAAHELISKRIRAGDLKGTALLCTTEPAAVGAMRAMADRGLRPGHDVPVCTVDGEGRAQYLIPSLTCISLSDPTPYLAVALEWMLAGSSRTWVGPLLLQPAGVELAVGESTVPAAKPKPGSRRSAWLRVRDRSEIGGFRGRRHSG